MKKESNLKFFENYEKLYEELKIKYQYKEKENQQLKALLKLRDKEIINLKRRLKNEDENVNYINTNNNFKEISQKYIQDLINAEVENIQKEQLIYRNKILTLENYELQYLAPKLTTGSNHNYHFSINNLISEKENNIDNLYYNMKYETKGKNAMGSDKKRVLRKNRFNSNLDNRYNILRAIDNEEDSFLKGSSSKLTTRVKQKLNI